MTIQAKLAAISAALCAIGFMAMTALGAESHWWGILLTHAAEGAMVGVLCDFIAVRNVFLQAQTNFDGLAVSLGNVVARDLLQVEALLADPSARVTDTWKQHIKPQLIEKLVAVDIRGWVVGSGDGGDARPAASVARVIANSLEQVADSDRLAKSLADVIQASASRLTLADIGLSQDAGKLEAQLSEAWKRAPRSKVIAWMVELDVRAELFDSGAGASPLTTKRARKVVADCIRAANSDANTLKRLRAAVLAKVPGFKGVVAPLFVGDDDVKGWLADLAAAVESNADNNDELGQALLTYVRGYLDGWHKQPASLRAAAASDVVDAVAPTVIKHLATALAAAAPHTTLAPVAEWVADHARIQKGIRSLAVWVRKLPYTPSGPSTGFGSVAADVALEWLEAWHGLAESIRRKAVSDLVGAFEPYVLEAIASAAQGANGGDLQAKVATLVTARIRAAGKENLVDMLRAQAGPKLDWIKVNGLVYGAIFGATTGLVALGIGAAFHK